MNAVTFAEEILAMSRELDYLRKEVSRLKHYETEYNTLVRDSIRHSNKMLANTVDLLKVPGVSEALQAAQVPEGFKPWAGGKLPVPEMAQVEVIFDDGLRGFCEAGRLRWPSTNPPGHGNITAYKIVAA